MCGIAGIIRITAPSADGDDDGRLSRTPGEAIPEAWLDTLDNSIKHRGPDGAGRFRDRAIRADGAVVDVALVHRRMAIIDLACGHQPMVSLGQGRGVITETKRFSLGGGLGLYEPGGYESLLSRAAQAAGQGVRSVERGGSSHAQPDGLRHVGSDRVAVAFNGCIYNHRELRRQLEAAGHVFSTGHSDTEVLVHGWREWGERLPEHLDGMYAFALWDATAAQVCIARDRSGEKPLYVCEKVPSPSADTGHRSEIIAFSSTLPGLQALSRYGTDAAYRSHVALDTPFWVAYGYNYAFGGNLPLPGLREALPASMSQSGHVHSGGEPSLATVRPTDSPVQFGTRTIRLTADSVDRLIVESVASRVDADVPVGVFLSGGTDSSIIAAVTHRIRPDIHAFTVRMPTSGHDESGPAARIARHIGIKHSIVECQAHPAEDLQHLIRQLGLPFGDSSLLPVYWVSRAAGRHVKVALSGDGADELFGGYQRYQAARWLRQWRWLAGLIPSSLLPQRDPRSRWAKAARLGRAARGNGYSDLAAIFDYGHCKDLMTRRPGSRGNGQQQLIGQLRRDGVPVKPMDDAVAERLLSGGALSRVPLVATRRFDATSVADAMLGDFLNYLPQDLLRKTDTASMAVPIEVRCPYLSRDLIHACTTATLESLMPHHERKGLLRAVARRYFPAEIVDRPKMGFAIPIGEWFRTNFGGMRDLLHDHLDAADPFGHAMNVSLDMNCIRQMLREHDQAGQKSLWPWKGRDHSQRLYMLLVLSIWCRWMASSQQQHAGTEGQSEPR